MIHDYGVAIEEPAGWHTRIVKIVAPIESPVMLHIATVPVATSDYSFYQYELCNSLGPNDAAIIAIIHAPDEVRSSTVVRDFSKFAFAVADYVTIQGLPRGQVQARRVLTVHNRECELVGCFGTTNPSATLLHAMTTSLRTLEVSPSSAKKSDGHGQEVSLA